MKAKIPILIDEKCPSEYETDPYSDDFDEEDALDSGWKSNELGFWQGFKQTR